VKKKIFYSQEASDRPFKEEAARMAKLKPKPKTYHEGANAERTAVLAKVRRMVKEQPTDGTEVYINGTALVKWLLLRNERYKANPGGL